MSIGLKGNTDGSGAVQIGGSDAITISTGLNTTFAGTVTATGTVAGSTGTLYPLVAGTAVASTSGTAIDFTGIPSWARRITVMFAGVSLSGTDQLLVQIGSGSVTTSGYASSSGILVNAGASAAVTSTSGFVVVANGAANIVYGSMVLTNVSSNTWVASHSLGFNGALSINGGGASSNLSGALDRVRITTTGTNTFDAGTINILYE